MNGADNFAGVMRKLMILLALGTSQMVQAQSEKVQLRPLFMLDTYYSTIGGRGADVFGAKAGVEVNNRWRFAAGYNKITSDIVEYKRLSASEAAIAGKEVVKAQLFMRYYPVMAEYVIYNKDPWQVSFPVQAGYGRSYFQYFDPEGGKRRIFERGVLVSDLAVAGQYKVLKWIGVGAGVGYRFMLVNNPEISTRFNTPVVSLRLKIFFSEVYKSIMHPDAR